MSNLFEESEQARLAESAPLAVRMCPRTLDEFVGQEHILGKGRLLRRMLEADRLTSVVFYGPPGTGKTALAQVIAAATRSRFIRLNATSASVKEVREVIDLARGRLFGREGRTVLFLDELHRFNRAQQDVLLPEVESGVLILIGATTLNPFFALVAPLISRSQIFEFKPLSNEEVKTILRRAMADAERGLGRYRIEMRDDALDHLAEMSDGDARRALTAMEVGVLSAGREAQGGVIVFDLDLAQESIQRKAVVYDGTGDEHYDAASAFIKSMRGSDPDAALYWMAKMLHAGEDPRFIARRMVICAAEDVGNAAPNALVLANAALQASEFVGMPECQIILAQAVTYIACSPKSNASYKGIAAAMKDVEEGRTLPVPDYLRDANYPGAKRLGRGEGYKYAHEFEGHWVEQDYLPVDKVYYEPTEEGFEGQFKKRLDDLRARRKRAKGNETNV